MLSNEQENIRTINYLKVLFRRKEVIIICTLVGLSIGIAVGFILPKVFQSSSIILVQEGKSDNPLFEELAVSTTVGERLAGIRESILGWDSMAEVVKRLGLDVNIKNQREFQAMILGLRKKVDIKLKGHNLIYLKYEGQDPEQTQAVVKTITDIFIDRNVAMQNQETEDAIKFIEEQLRVYKGKIKSAEIAKLQDQLDQLRVDSTEKHPMVRRLREQIDAKKKELKEENLDFLDTVDLGPQATNPLIDEIKRALNSLDPRKPENAADGESDLYKAMLMANLDNVAARDVQVNEFIYNTLLQRLETAKITQRLQSSKEGTKYTILDPPRIPLSPVKPNKIIIAFIGLLLGCALGAGLIFAAEFLDKSFIDVEEAKEFFGVPLLAAISRIETKETIRRDRERKQWMYALAIVLCAIILASSFGLSTLIN